MGYFGFSDTVFEHFMRPRNIGEMNDADSIGTIGEPDCGENSKRVPLK